MLKYKAGILPTLALFFKNRNEIDIYIEDANDEEFYKALFSRLYDRIYRIDKIISLHCRENVVNACLNDQKPRNRKRVYIIDGDLDLVFDNNPKDLKHLYVLDRYCVENFLFDEEGVVEVLHDIVVLDKDKIRKALGFSKWLTGLSQSLIDLFLHYSISHEHTLGIKTVSTSVGSLCKQDRGMTILDIQKVNSLICTIRDQIITNIGEEEYLQIIHDRRQRWTFTKENLLKVVSGKDYLLPLLEFRFKKIKGKESYNLKRESLRLKLAKLCDLTPFNALKNI
ncbi:MAG: DUF4435 domain-containing protein [Sphingobacteriales bacterium]|nr:MAG: DUF4435 domain-containing protein [Sphingobacteriales bacterium]